MRSKMYWFLVREQSIEIQLYFPYLLKLNAATIYRSEASDNNGFIYIDQSSW